MATVSIDRLNSRTPLFDQPTIKIKDWFYAKNIKNTVPSETWTYVLGIARETEKAILAVIRERNGDEFYDHELVWIPKSCTEEIEDTRTVTVRYVAQDGEEVERTFPMEAYARAVEENPAFTEEEIATRMVQDLTEDIVKSIVEVA